MRPFLWPTPYCAMSSSSWSLSCIRLLLDIFFILLEWMKSLVHSRFYEFVLRFICCEFLFVLCSMNNRIAHADPKTPNNGDTNELDSIIFDFELHKPFYVSYCGSQHQKHLQCWRWARNWIDKFHWNHFRLTFVWPHIIGTKNKYVYFGARSKQHFSFFPNKFTVTTWIGPVTLYSSSPT